MIRKSTTEWTGDGPTGSGSKANCPVSKALSATPISLTARLV